MEKPRREEDGIPESLENWDTDATEAERLRIEKLQAMTEEESAELFNRLYSDWPMPESDERKTWSGLIEQQRLFAKGHSKAYKM